MTKNAFKPVFEMTNVCTSVVGIVGGMGSYATIHFFRTLVDAFPVEKEWERPRVIIDNNCVMPSRVRAILYGERREELVGLLADSIERLLGYNVDMIVLACNTSHYFLPEIRKKVKLTDDVLVDLLGAVTQRCREAGTSEILVLATEGTIATKVYDQYCHKYSIEVSYPNQKDQPILRGFIEKVKQRQWDGLKEEFAGYLSELDYPNIVMGCTELSVVYDALADKEDLGKNIIDPVQLAVDTIHARITEPTV